MPLSLLLCYGVLAAATTSFLEQGVIIKVHGHSGKVTISRNVSTHELSGGDTVYCNPTEADPQQLCPGGIPCDANDLDCPQIDVCVCPASSATPTPAPSKDDNSVTIDMGYLYEMDKDGNEVGKTGKIKHSFNSFASQNFEFSTLETVKMNNISASRLTFTATLVDDHATFTVWLYVFRSNGTIHHGSSSSNVTAGSIKLSYSLESWPFCTAGGSGVNQCTHGKTEEEGDHIDFGIELKSKSGARYNDGVVHLGGNVTLELENSIQVDGVWTEMAEGYPKVTTQGAVKTEITFQFPRFKNNISYDPTFDFPLGSVSPVNPAPAPGPGPAPVPNPVDPKNPLLKPTPGDGLSTGVILVIILAVLGVLAAGVAGLVFMSQQQKKANGNYAEMIAQTTV